MIYFKLSYNSEKYFFEEYASAILRAEGGNMFMRNTNTLTPRLHYFRSDVFLYSIAGPSSLAYVTGLKNWKKKKKIPPESRKALAMTLFKWALFSVAKHLQLGPGPDHC